MQITNGQASTQSNTSYVTDNGSWIQNELRESAHLMPAVLTYDYNFGSPYRHLLPSVQVNAGAELYFNHTYRPIGGGDQRYAHAPSVPGNFEAYTPNCATIVQVNSGGLIGVGTPGSINSTHPASLRISANSLLDLRAGGRLDVNVGSVLRIPAGATLVVRNGAALNIYGEVVVEAGAYLCVETPSNIVTAGSGTYTVSPAANFFAKPGFNLGPLACNQPPTSPFYVDITSLVYRSWCTSSSNRDNYAEFTAAATGGTGVYGYDWYVDPSRTGNNYQLAGRGQTFGTCMNSYSSLIFVRVVATSGTQTASADYYAAPQLRQAVYPNPADAYVEVVGSEDAALADHKHKPMHITVHNGQGKEVFTAAEITTPTLRVNTQAWPTGLYQVTVKRGKTVTRRQLSVEH